MAVMGSKSREVIYGGRIIGAKIRAEGAREAAQKAVREADRAAAELWSIQMEAYGGPAQPSPTIACHLPLAAIAAASKPRLEHGKRTNGRLTSRTARDRGGHGRGPSPRAFGVRMDAVGQHRLRYMRIYNGYVRAFCCRHDLRINRLDAF
jgi:hypothetical protein